MSWSSDIRCLYCDGKLPLYRKITNGQFCSAPHRKLYWKEQERLGVERLHQTHDSLRAFRPPEGVEAILGPAISYASYPGTYPMPAPPPAGVVMPPEQPFVYEADLDPRTPLWAPQIAEPSEPAEEVEAPAPVGGFIPLYNRPQPRWPMGRLEFPEPSPFAAAASIRMPLRAASLARDVATAGLAVIPITPRHYESSRKLEPLPTLMQPCRDVAHSASPAGNALEAPGEEVPRV